MSLIDGCNNHVNQDMAPSTGPQPFFPHIRTAFDAEGSEIEKLEEDEQGMWSI